MSEQATEPAGRVATTATAERRECDAEGCQRDAVEVLRFRNQPGHVHVCARDAATDREWCDVVWAEPMPCTQPHDGSMWTAQPQGLA